MAWANQKLTLFHGTNTFALGQSPNLRDRISLTIDLNRCRPDTDFGQGFYATTSFHQASQWANNSVRLAQNQITPIASDAIVLRFDVARDDLAVLDFLGFVRDTDDFYDLVAFCRSRTAPGLPRSHGRHPPNLAYDVVFGPVALGNQRLVIQGRDQVSFHTDAAVNYLSRGGIDVYDKAATGSGFLP